MFWTGALTVEADPAELPRDGRGLYARLPADPGRAGRDHVEDRARERLNGHSHGTSDGPSVSIVAIQLLGIALVLVLSGLATWLMESLPA